jgi:hypothetical protein
MVQLILPFNSKHINTMDEQQISAMVTKEVTAWFASQQGQTDGYQYEKTFVECWHSVGKKVLQESLGHLPGSKNEKKNFKAVLDQ